MRDPVRVSQLVGVWLKCARRSSGRHCPVVSAASHCGFATAPDSTVCFQFCKLLCIRSTWLLPLPQADSREGLVLFSIRHHQHS